MPMRLLTASDASLNVAAAFVVPPMAICITGLLMRIAIHYSFWGAVPLFFMVLVLGSVSCFILAIWHARGVTGASFILRFTGWILASALCITGGLTLVGLLPITVGDGP